MFSRRHPYLYFLLIFSAILSTAALGLSLVILAGIRGAGLGAVIQSGENQVGVVEILGPISSSRETLEELKRFRESDDDIRAIVVRIDSPGGGVGPSQEIYRAIRKTREVKQVVASLGSVAASGGYYIAAGAGKIVANPGTITGSIGVIMGFANYEELLKKIGLVPVVVKSGEYKDIGSPVRKMVPEEREILEALAGEIHRQFIRDIVSGRGMDAERVASLADGRIFTGEESLAMGFVDRLGNVEDAIEWAGRLGGINGEVTAVYAKERKLGLLEYVLMSSRLKMILERLLRPELRAEFIYDPLTH